MTPARVASVALAIVALSFLPGHGSRAGTPLAEAPGPPPELIGIARGVVELPSPAGPGSGEPDLAVASDGTLFMSWLERSDSLGWRLRVSRLAGTQWQAPLTIAEGESLFVNWADAPRLIAPAKDHLVAAWMWKRPGGTYAYDVRVASSRDGGRKWSAPATPHRDGTATEHGFVSLVPERGGVRMVWLDGRNGAGKAEGEAEMTLRTAWLGADGVPGNDELLDPRVCDCCQTAAAATATGTMVAFRDRDPDEIRDIGIVRRSANWERSGAPRDGWKIAGCPVNGPSLAARRNMVALGWYSAPSESARVRLAISRDGGERLMQVSRVDDGDPIGRVATAILPDGPAVVAWLEHERDGRASVRVRKVGVYETPRRSATVALTTASRSSGFPRIAIEGKRVIVAWTDDAKPARVRVSAIPIAGL